jgi:5-methylcytosine-specific restriction endonuclease McrA
MSCLALNASFEPLTIVPARRAVRLVLDGKAEILEEDSGRFVRYVHVPYRFRRQVTNTFLFARDDYTCQYCGRRKSELRGRQFLTRDHIRPISRGGLNSWDNVVTSCSPCNNRKGGRLPAEAGLTLRHEPSEPNYVHLVWVVRRVTDAQAKYIRMFYGEAALDEVAARPGLAPEVIDSPTG